MKNTNDEQTEATIEYYNKNAEIYFNETVRLNLDELYDEFLPLIPKHGYILDAGCGSGRDTLAFLKRGFRVSAFDASKELAKRASKLTGLDVSVRTFQELDENEVYDGVWACASLLHVPRASIYRVISNLQNALKPSGILHVSFQYGDDERMINGRFFNFYTKKSLLDVTKDLPSLSLVKIWVTDDVRKSTRTNVWLNAIFRKNIIQADTL